MGRRRTGRNLMLALLLAALCAGAAAAPQWVLRWQIGRTAQQAEVLWCGSVPFGDPEGTAWPGGTPLILARSGTRLLAGRMSRYEGRAMLGGVGSCAWPEEGQVLPMPFDGFTAPLEAGTLGGLMVPNLPQGTVGGTLTVLLAGEARTAQGVRRGDMMFFLGARRRGAEGKTGAGCRSALLCGLPAGALGQKGSSPAVCGGQGAGRLEGSAVMEHSAWREWLDTAVERIALGFEQAEVRRELESHLEDRTSEARKRNPALTREEAERLALREMGAPEALRDALAEVYDPLGGWLWAASVLLLMTAAAVFFLFLFLAAGLVWDLARPLLSGWLADVLR